jgi:hypothetical protein
MMASAYEWANFFSGKYTVHVDGVDVHAADLKFTVKGYYCMKVSMVPVKVSGSANGFFHLVDAQCLDHRGDYQKIGVLKGGVMECSYTGKEKERGYFRVGFWEEEPSFRPDWMVSGTWRGTLFIQRPKEVKKGLIMKAHNKKKRPDDNYPWNR